MMNFEENYLSYNFQKAGMQTAHFNIFFPLPNEYKIFITKINGNELFSLLKFLKKFTEKVNPLN